MAGWLTQGDARIRLQISLERKLTRSEPVHKLAFDHCAHFVGDVRYAQRCRSSAAFNRPVGGPASSPSQPASMRSIDASIASACRWFSFASVWGLSLDMTERIGKLFLPVEKPTLPSGGPRMRYFRFFGSRSSSC